MSAPFGRILEAATTLQDALVYSGLCLVTFDPLTSLALGGVYGALDKSSEKGRQKNSMVLSCIKIRWLQGAGRGREGFTWKIDLDMFDDWFTWPRQYGLPSNGRESRSCFIVCSRRNHNRGREKIKRGKIKSPNEVIVLQ